MVVVDEPASTTSASAMIPIVASAVPLDSSPPHWPTEKPRPGYPQRLLSRTDSLSAAVVLLAGRMPTAVAALAVVEQPLPPPPPPLPLPEGWPDPREDRPLESVVADAVSSVVVVAVKLPRASEVLARLVK